MHYYAVANAGSAASAAVPPLLLRCWCLLLQLVLAATKLYCCGVCIYPTAVNVYTGILYLFVIFIQNSQQSVTQQSRKVILVPLQQIHLFIVNKNITPYYYI